MLKTKSKFFLLTYNRKENFRKSRKCIHIDTNRKVPCGKLIHILKHCKSGNTKANLGHEKVVT
uniref:Uncharacterized protein n=1 Tax=Romanomermis culicivorax TaxID=13658 RepID=A0A915KQY3_ROMCU